MAAHRRRDDLRRRERLPLPDHADLLVDVVAERERAAQRNLVRRVAADDRVLHVEVRVGDRGLDAARERDALVRQPRLELRRRVEHVPDEVDRRRRVVELPLLEREEPRVALLDDADLDAARERQALPPVLRDDRAVRGIGAVREALVAEAGVGLEHDPLAAPPLLEPVRPGADRVRHHPPAAVPIGLDHLARDGAGGGRREVRHELGVREVEPDPDRVAIDRLQAGDRLVVVEPAALARRGDQLVHPLEAPVEHLHRVRAHARIEHALPRVDVVVGGELALPALEHGVVGEVDARLHADRPQPPPVGDLGQRDGGVRDQLVGAREVVVLVERVEDHAIDRVRVDIARGLRIEAGLGRREHRADHLRRIGLGERVARAKQRERGGRSRARERGGPHHSSLPMSASSAFGSTCGA